MWLMRLWRRPLALAVVSAALLMPGTVEGHAFLVRTTPEHGERLAASPPSIELRFSEPVSRVEEVVVETAGGAPVETGPLQIVEGGLVARVPVPSLDDDVYVVSWRVLADDGHTSLGEFAFAVGEAGEVSTQVRQVAAGIWRGATAGWLFLMGPLLAFGALASEYFIWRPVASRHALVVPRVKVGWLLTIALAGGALQLLLLAEPARVAGDGWVSMLRSRPILLGLAQLLAVLYGAWLLAMPGMRHWAMIPLGLALTVAATRGHSSVTEHWWAAPANAIHVLAVALWVGALAHLVLVLWRSRGSGARPALGEGARRYAALALGLVALVLASGVISALAQLTSPAELIRSTYGRVLLIKLGLVVAALGLAVAARRWGLPSSIGPRLAPLRRLTRIEGILLLAVIAVAGVLANATPPWSLQAADTVLGAAPLEAPVQRLAAQAGWLSVYVGAAEGQLRVWAAPPGEDSDPGVDVEITGRMPDGKTFDITPRSCGPGCATTAFPWQEGTTTLSVTAQAREWEGGTVEFQVAWPPEPENEALLNRVIETMRAQPQMTVNERVTSGPGATGEYTFSITGERFIAQELYAAGGASDIRPIPTGGDARTLTLYLPGSSIWYRLEVDRENRIQRETIVNRGHLIERSFTYETPMEPSPSAGS